MSIFGSIWKFLKEINQSISDFDNGLLIDPADLPENNLTKPHQYPPSFRQLAREGMHNARTMEGTIEIGLPRLKNEIIGLRKDIAKMNINNNNDEIISLKAEVAELKKKVAELQE